MERSRQLLGRGARVLVTGATGFIGANVVRALLHLGSDVHITVQSSSDPWRLEDVLPHVETHVASLTDADALQRAFVRARPAVVLHLATPRGRDEAARARILEATVMGAIHLLRLAREHDVQRLVVAGSSLEYRPSDAPLTEDACRRAHDRPRRGEGSGDGALSAGGTSKRVCPSPCSACSTCTVRGNRGTGCCRPRSAPRSTARRFPRPAEPSRATGCSSLTWSTRCSAPWACIATARSSTWVPARRARTKPLSRAWPTRLDGRSGTVAGAFPRGPADVAHRCADRSKAARLLGWSPQATLGDGVRQTVDWFEANPAAWSADADEHPSAV